MNDHEALLRIHMRDRLLAIVLEKERAQGWPAPFDWRAWRRNRANVVAELRSRTYWSDKGRPQAVDNSVYDS